MNNFATLENELCNVLLQEYVMVVSPGLDENNITSTSLSNILRIFTAVKMWLGFFLYIKTCDIFLFLLKHRLWVYVEHEAVKNTPDQVLVVRM